MSSNKPYQSALRVCHCTISGSFGGIERQIHSLVTTQSRKAEVGVILAMKGGHFAEDLASMERVSTLVLGLKSGMDIRPSTIAEAKRFLAQYDVVHMHAFNYVLLLAAVWARKKVVFTFHSLTHMRRKLSPTDKVKFMTLKLACRVVFAGMTTVSHFMSKQIQEHLGISQHIDIVYNITPEVPQDLLPGEIVRNELGIAEDACVVLTYSRLVKNKRVDVFLDAAALLKDTCDVPLRFIVMGDGPHKEELEETAKRHSLGASLLFLPFQENVFNYVQAADVCVFPSHHEAFGIVALETLAMGKPTLVMQDGGGLVEITKDILNGAFLSESTEELAEKITYFCTEKNMSGDLARQCKERAQSFSSEEICKAYEAVYRKAVQKG